MEIKQRKIEIETRGDRNGRNVGRKVNRDGNLGREAKLFGEEIGKKWRQNGSNSELETELNMNKSRTEMEAKQCWKLDENQDIAKGGTI